MAKGAAYHRFSTLGRPKPSEYREKAVDQGLCNAKIENVEITCKHCGFKARYRFRRCPECEREQG